MQHRYYVFCNTERLLDPTIQEACPFLRRAPDPLEYAEGFVQHGKNTGQSAELYKFEFEGQKLVAAAIVPPGGKAIDLAKEAANEFLRLMEELAIECRVGHPTAIRKAETRRQKHDRRDAALLLRLLTEGRFPAIWMPSTELRDLRALLLHRHQWVRLRTRVQNALHAIALGSGVQRGHALWNQDSQAMLTSLPLPPHGAHRRDELQALYRQLDEQVDRLDDRVKFAAAQRPRATALMTHPGVGPVTALATEVFLGDPSRFVDGKALASYVGMIPSEYSSGGRQRLGRLSKQGNPLLRFLWGEAAMHAVRRDPELQRFYRRKLPQKVEE
jgi:transposase